MWVFELIIELSIAVPPYALGAAAVLSLAQAWVLGSERRRACRYLIAGTVSSAILVTPILWFLGFPHTIYPAHRNVAWTGAGVSAAITAGIFSVTARRRPLSSLSTVALLPRAWALFPGQVGLLIVLGTLEYIALGFVFLGNIH